MADPLARVARRPDPADWPLDEPMTLKELIAVFYPDGPITVSTLRAEIAAGRLTPARVGGRFFVTPGGVRALFLQAATSAAALTASRSPSPERVAAARRSLRLALSARAPS